MPLADRTRWDARHRESPGGSRRPEPFLVESIGRPEGPGRALDLAGGPGRNAAWLAGLGWDVTLADISTVALDEVSRIPTGEKPIRTLAIDLEEAPCPAGPWDLIVCVRFLDRPLYRSIPDRLAGGGLAIVVHPTLANLERHARPGPRHLLGLGELPGLLPGLEVVEYREGWTDEGRHEVHYLGRRPARGPG